MKKLIIFAGGNGAGKTTLYKEMKDEHFSGLHYINADELLKERTGANYLEASALGQELAQKRIAECFALGESFVFETVFSHVSKLTLIDRAKALGYNVQLYFVHVESTEINIRRVKQRVLKGGHDVPESKIRARIPRTLFLIREALEVVDSFKIFDNTNENSRAKKVAERSERGLIFGGLSPEWALKLISSEEDESKA